MTGGEKIAVFVFGIMVGVVALAALMVMLGYRPTVGMGSW